ncbi:MAG: amino acid ABC transporter permease [Actinomycetota bacterium]|nr:amino acid ABC transporter permease [Actinomycetota bacterium]MDK1102057.1 amino acid ABC transporter permease [Actinomycetota bacterium]
MTTSEATTPTAPAPPGSKASYDWSSFPWWFVGILLTILFPVYKMLTDETWADGFLFIKDGIALTFTVTIGGFFIAVIVGLFVAFGRMSKRAVPRNLAMYYIELMRGIPVLVTLFMIGLVIAPWIFEMLGIGPRTAIASKAVRATVAVGLIYAAFIAEVFRAGIESVGRGQWEAGMSLGLNRWKVFRLVVWPQAIKNVLPALGNDLIALLKDSSLVSILAVRELTQMSKLWTGRSFQFFAGFMILAAMYLTLTVSLSLALQWYERKISTP